MKSWFSWQHSRAGWHVGYQYHSGQFLSWSSCSRSHPTCCPRSSWSASSPYQPPVRILPQWSHGSVSRYSLGQWWPHNICCHHTLHHHSHQSRRPEIILINESVPKMIIILKKILLNFFWDTLYHICTQWYCLLSVRWESCLCPCHKSNNQIDKSYKYGNVLEHDTYKDSGSHRCLVDQLLHLVLGGVPLVPEPSHVGSHVVPVIIITAGPVSSMVGGTVLLLKSSSIIVDNPVIVGLWPGSVTSESSPCSPVMR